MVRSLLSPNGCAYPVPPVDVALEVGTSARLIDGLFGELAGVVKLSAGARVSLLFQIMGHAVPVMARRCAVEAVAG